MIEPLTLKADFFFLILDSIGHYSVVQVLWFDIKIFKVESDPLNRSSRPLKQHFILFFLFFSFGSNWALISRSGPMVQHKNF